MCGCFVMCIEASCIVDGETAVGSDVSTPWVDWMRGPERSGALTIDQHGQVVLEVSHSKCSDKDGMLLALIVQSRHTVAGSLSRTLAFTVVGGIIRGLRRV